MAKSKFFLNDGDKDIENGICCDTYFTIYDAKDIMDFETLINQVDIGKGHMLNTYSNPIDSIRIEGDSGFNQITLYFGNFGHIHLEKEYFKLFVKGVNKVYETITFNKVKYKCSKCKFSKTIKFKERFCSDKKLKEEFCPECKIRMGVTIFN